MFDPEEIIEWSPLENLLNQIPVKASILRNLNLTCVATNQQFISLGTDCGVVLWYNRIKKELQKLKIESTSAVISCLEIIDSVEFMVAAGDDSGRITVFQIEKEHPPDIRDLVPRPKPIERYTITIHKHLIKALAWSRNGMKLFSGDRTGAIVLTEIDYSSVSSNYTHNIMSFKNCFIIFVISLSHPIQNRHIMSLLNTIICFYYFRYEKMGESY